MTEGCLRVGQFAPDFTATAVYDQEFKPVKLSDYRGKYVVLFQVFSGSNMSEVLGECCSFQVVSELRF